MIQELLGGATVVAAERKISINGAGGGTPSPSSTTTNSTATATATATATSSNSENQNLRCPRCDSPNTKFCYYNNYNLTQPRHFCKTCRRYWTKGGALRNVPIGGGCRKNKSAIGVSNSAAKTSTTKMRTVPSELGRSTSSGVLGPVGFDQELPLPTPILWGSPQNTHLLSLLRATQNQNPNPNPMSCITVKEEGNLMGLASQSHMDMVMSSDPLVLNPRSLGCCYDGVGVGVGVAQPPSLGLCSNGGFVLGEHQNNTTGIQELYHKLIRPSSTNYYSSDTSPLFLGSMASSSSSSSSSISSILEPTNSVAAGDHQMGYWNPTISSWSDLPNTNGAYP